ncbi:unnamed protein product [Sphagnum troendelagicum]|uniref:RING-type E3 ubiquitin transferase n=1 Tax=Sphagnum troendelagicum TaxID=128251 RepID=A0ABP0U2L9_9BRYO
MTSTRNLEIANIPSYFRCPISFNLMKDPVSLCTGITYDRVSIQRWFDNGNTTCPATMQQVHSRDLTPNHTLRRLIQEWSVKNLSQELGIVERIPTPKQPADLLQVHHMLQDITDGYMRLENLQRLHGLARDSEKNRRCVLEAGAVPVLASVITAAAAVVTGCVEEALATLALLPMDDEKTRKSLTGPTQLEQMNWFLTNGCCSSRDSRVYAACLLANLVEQDVEFKSAMASQPLLLEGLVSLLKEEAATAAVSRSCNNNNNNRGSAAAAARAGAIASLKCFAAICLARKIRVKAIDAGVAPALVDTLMLQVQPSSEELQLENETVTELAVCVLDLICACAEGRAAVCDRVEAITALVKIVLRQSKLATEHALAALWAICRSTADSHIQLEAVRAGLFTKLLVLVQSDHDPRTKAIAGHLLRLLQNTGRQNSLECLILKPL